MVIIMLDQVKQDIEDLEHSYNFARTKEEKDEIFEEIQNLEKGVFNPNE